MPNETTSFTVAEYAKALSRLPMRYLALEYRDLHHVVFQGNIIVAYQDYAPMIYRDQRWHEMSINAEHGVLFDGES